MEYDGFRGWDVDGDGMGWASSDVILLSSMLINPTKPALSVHSSIIHFCLADMTLATDLLNPLESSELRKHKLKRLVQSPNSYFMDVKCPSKLPTPTK